MTEAQTNFFKLVVPLALESYKTYPIPPCVTIAQAILESGWGKSYLSSHFNNYFGIKFNESALKQGYKEYLVQTHEGTPGINDSVIKAGFVEYPLPIDSFLDHGRLLCSSIYIKAYLLRNDWTKYIEALGPKLAINDERHCGYSTNLLYAQTLRKLITDYNLDKDETLNSYLPK